MLGIENIGTGLLLKSLASHMSHLLPALLISGSMSLAFAPHSYHFRTKVTRSAGVNVTQCHAKNLMCLPVKSSSMLVDLSSMHCKSSDCHAKTCKGNAMHLVYLSDKPGYPCKPWYRAGIVELIHKKLTLQAFRLKSHFLYCPSTRLHTVCGWICWR